MLLVIWTTSTQTKHQFDPIERTDTQIQKRLDFGKNIYIKKRILQMMSKVRVCLTVGSRLISDHIVQVIKKHQSRLHLVFNLNSWKNNDIAWLFIRQKLVESAFRCSSGWKCEYLLAGNFTLPSSLLFQL